MTNHSFCWEDCLYATPWTPLSEVNPVQDALGFMPIVQSLQRAVFPQFTVLTNSRWSAELLLVMIGIAQQTSNWRQSGWPRNLRYRALELFWASTVLSHSGGDRAEMSGVLNARRFFRFWENRQRRCVRLPADPEAACFGSLGYGITPHYWNSLFEWGLVERSEDDAVLTADGMAFFRKLMPFKSRRMNSILGRVRCWMDPRKGLTEEELFDAAADFAMEGDTFPLWFDQAERVAQKANGAFPAVWRLVSPRCVNPHACRAFAKELKESFPNASSLGAALRLWVEERADDLPDKVLGAELKSVIRDCRDFERIEGSARFILDAMAVAAEKLSPCTSVSLAGAWKNWLAPLARNFAAWTAACRNPELRNAFCSTDPNRPESFLDAVLSRHMGVKPMNAFLVQNGRGEIVRTQEEPPDLREVSKFLEDIDRDGEDGVSLRNHAVLSAYGERSWHWQRFADWMRITLGEEESRGEAGEAS